MFEREVNLVILMSAMLLFIPAHSYHCLLIDFLLEVIIMTLLPIVIIQVKFGLETLLFLQPLFLHLLLIFNYPWGVFIV